MSKISRLMRGSCHLDRALNFEIGVKHWKIFVVLFFNVAVKRILGHLPTYRKGWVIKNINIAEQFVLLLDPAKIKKVNKHFKIRHQFQYLTTRPNDMIHTLLYNSLQQLLTSCTRFFPLSFGSFEIDVLSTNLDWSECQKHLQRHNQKLDRTNGTPTFSNANLFIFPEIVEINYVFSM